MSKALLGLCFWLLALFSTSGAYYVPVVQIDCASRTITPADCKREFRFEFEEGFRFQVIELAKTLTDNSKTQVNLILQEISNDDSQTERRSQLIEMLKYYETYVQSIIGKQNHTAELLVLVTNDPNLHKYNLPELLASHKHPYENLELKNYRAVNQFTDNICKTWIDLYKGIRISDWQAYPQYEEINNMAKVMASLDDVAKVEVFKTFLRKVFIFLGIIN